MVARYGGEEFAILLPDTDLSGSRVTAEHIRSETEKSAFHFGSATIRITVSAGLSSRNAHRAAKPQELLTNADQALYRAKAAGRNRIAIFSPEEHAGQACH